MPADPAGRPAAVRAGERIGSALRWRLSALTQGALRRLEPNRALVLTEYPTSPRPMWGWGRPTNPQLAARLERAMPAVAELARELNELAEWCATVPRHPSAPKGLAWENKSWGSIDAVMQVHALKQRRCATYLEVGSGFSTMFARKAIEDFDLPTRIVSVDPQPRAEIDAICDVVVRQPFEDVAEEVLAELAPGDVFLFDGSHLATMASDATVLFCGLLEHIPPGVLLGVDDIYLPDDYHPTWVDKWYGEQYLVAAWLLGGHEGWEVRLPAWHATAPERAEDLFAPLWPHIEAWGGRRGTCLWVERPAG
jgi:hypothetical protein